MRPFLLSTLVLAAVWTVVVLPGCVCCPVDGGGGSKAESLIKQQASPLPAATPEAAKSQKNQP